jgi:hypothetical protein
VDRIPDHFKQALVKLAMPFWGKPRIASLLYALIRQVQVLEDTIADVAERYTIDGADDARLAILGKIVGQSRLGAWSTETYRAVIRGRIRAARSHGRTDDLIEVLRLVTETTDPIAVEHVVPATAIITMPAPVDDEHMIAVEFLLPKTRAAGVKLHFIRPVSDTPLDWADVTDPGSGGDFADTTIPGSGDDAYDVRTF